MYFTLNDAYHTNFESWIYDIPRSVSLFYRNLQEGGVIFSDTLVIPLRQWVKTLTSLFQQIDYWLCWFTAPEFLPHYYSSIQIWLFCIHSWDYGAVLKTFDLHLYFIQQCSVKLTVNTWKFSHKMLAISFLTNQTKILSEQHYHFPIVSSTYAEVVI